MLISLSLIAVAASQIEIQGGTCAPVPVMPDFDLGRYGGLWYEQIRYPFNRAGPTDKCVTANYLGIDDITVSVNNSVIKTDDDGLFYKSSVLGTAVQTEPETSGNKLYVCIVRCNDGEVEPTYNVMDTDYENYAIVYTACEDMGDYVVELYYILSRTQDFKNTEMYEEVIQKAVEFGFRRELAEETPQEVCEFDYFSNDEQGPPTTTNTTTTTTTSTTTTTATTTSNLALYHALSLQLLVTILYINI